MLVVTAKEPRPQRIQGAWVRESEVRDIVDWVKNQREAVYQDKEVVEVVAAVAAAQAEDENDDDAELIRQATDLVVRSQLGSTSMLQRKLRIGFAQGRSREWMRSSAKALSVLRLGARHATF